MRRRLITAIVVCVLALVALLAYSLERTAWLFERFETWTPAAYAAAVVVELAAVALIVGASALAHLEPSARAWANRALVAVLSIQALANLSAGYLRGGSATLARFGSDRSAYAVAATLWFVTNLAVPVLILCLSKLCERLLSALPAREETRPSAPLVSVHAPAVGALPASAPKALPARASVSPRRRAKRSQAVAIYTDAGDPRWPCPRCGAALTSGRAVGAAKTNGGCSTCRGKEV